jgi:hypothetical protein
LKRRTPPNTRFETQILDRRRFVAARSGDCDVARRDRIFEFSGRQLAAARFDDAGRFLLRRAVLSRRVGGVSASRGGYEHADRRRHGRGFYLFGSGDVFPVVFYARERANMADARNGNMRNASVPVYFEAASVIIALILLGRMLESRAKGQTGAAIRKKLIGLQAKTARVVRDGVEMEIETEEVVPGDVVHRPTGRKNSG